jgi:hypothetical protein
MSKAISKTITLRDDFMQGVRMMPMVGSHMLPTLRPNDLIVVSPIDGFEYDSLYVLDVLGVPCVHRCQHVGAGRIRVFSDDPIYQGSVIDHDQFSEIVLGIVTATCRVLDHDRMGIA